MTVFPVQHSFRQCDEGEKATQIWASFTLWQRPSFPFPPIISTSSYALLGKGGGAFLSALSDDVIHSSAANKNPPPPRAPTPKPQAHQSRPLLMHSCSQARFLISLAKKQQSRASTLFARIRVILLNCSSNKQQLHR